MNASRDFACRYLTGISLCASVALSGVGMGATVVAWGDHTSGQTNVPSGLTNIVAIAAGSGHNLALRSDGTVVAWGANGAGQTNVPSDLTNAVAIAGGWDYSLAVRDDGTVAAWGANEFNATNVPPDLTNAIAVAAGGYHNLGLRNDGTVVAWGSEDLLDVPKGLSNVVAIAAENIRSLALKTDRTLAAWGHNYFTNVPAGLTNVVAIAVGDFHYLALRSDGTVVGWGYDYYGETRVPPGVSNVVAIAAGFEQSMVLTEEGTVVAWGYQSSISQVPSGLSNAVAIALGHTHAMALLGDGSPFVTAHPFGQSVVTGHEAVFDVTVVGPRPIDYQWRRDGVDLPGATNASLRLPSVQSSDGGTYTVLVRNAVGQAESRPAKLLALEIPPVVRVQPTNQQFFSGGEANFHATAEGSLPFSYQWRWNGLVLPGATNADLRLPEAQPGDSGIYTVLVSNSAGQTESGPAELNVIASPPLVQVEPTNQHAAYGGSASFQVTADGSRPFTYQWFFQGDPMPDATDATLVITNADRSKAGLYWVRIANQYGAITSAPATLCLSFDYEFAAPEGPLLWDFSGTYPAPLSVTLQQNAAGWLTDGASTSGHVSGSGSSVWLYLDVSRPVGFWFTVSPYARGWVWKSRCTTSLSLSQGAMVLGGTRTCSTTWDEYWQFLWTWAYAGTHTESSSNSLWQPLPEGIDGHWKLSLSATTNGNQLSGEASLTLSSSNVIRLHLTGTNSPATGKSDLTLWDDVGNLLALRTFGAGLEIQSIRGRVANQQIVYTARSPLTLTIDGHGTVPSFDANTLLTHGERYLITAKPRPGCLFSNWVVNGVAVANPKLAFTMSSALRIVAHFVPNPFLALKGNYTGLFYDTNIASHQSAGGFALTLGDKGAFSGTLRQGAAKYPFRGQFDLALSAQQSVARRGTDEVAVILHLASGSDQIRGDVRGATWSSELFGYRATFNRHSRATHFQGAYTLLLPGATDAAEGPAGHGSARLTVSSGGSVSLKGMLPDAGAVAQTAPLAANGQWPVYAGLYSGKGSIFGWLTLLGTETNDVMGRLLWTKPVGVPSPFYPSGFDGETELIGSRYANPGKGTRVLQFSNAVAVLDGGNLESALSHDVELGAQNRLTVLLPNPEKLRFTLAAGNGTWRGSFVHPQTGRPTTIRGVLLQKQNFGAGYFTGTNECGSVYLGPPWREQTESGAGTLYQ